MFLLRAAVRLLFPPRCQLCGAPGEFPLCGGCLHTFPQIRPPFCPRCGHPLVARGAAPLRCRGCPGEGAAYTRARAWGAYDGPLREAIHTLKFGRRRALAGPLGALLAGLAASDPGLQRVQAIVPVPLHPQRQRERGFNQAHLLAAEVGRALGVPVEARVLERGRPTPAQAELSAASRRANVRGAFILRGAVRWARVLVVDDVMSTGSTVGECAQVLRQGGAGEVAVLTLARTVRTGPAEAAGSALRWPGGAAWRPGGPGAPPGPGEWR
ncbi:MAG: ComF family protein [Armatimonadota bacterium]|nr:ComF family protein [Armatimonadota bacterium]MDR7452555.1 ComF family protein [Armatimonadota bacterium]MDR7466885.1 ComF family protein [Armatimonadota bacterium]MDR7492642.1 ComF family protein [Armatimonadota bacterium]MDR7499996.1 ComF family protein [Armatimonadota bacterium]